MSRREEILDIVSKVVALPACVGKASSLLENNVEDFAILARIIEHDPGLTANLLKMVNASAIARRHPIQTTRDALCWLEAPDILQFVISTGLAPTYVRTIDGYDQSPGMYLQQSVAVAIAACKLGKALGVSFPAYTYTAALLAGVGKLVLGTYVKVDMHKLMSKVLAENLPFDKAEDAVLGINHAEVGEFLLKRWGLPTEITDVVRYHLRPDDYAGESLVLDLVHVGNLLAKLIGVGLGADGLNYDLSTNSIERLGVTPEIADRVSAEVVTELGGFWDLFVECVDRVCVL
jgi:HD-like signal output (HDOD) protein